MENDAQGAAVKKPVVAVFQNVSFRAELRCLAWSFFAGIAAVLAVFVVGCASRSKAQAKAAAAAFAAGQRQAFEEMAEARPVNIRVLGPVRHPEIEWADGLTLAEAIVAADYTMPGDPRAIYIIRQRERLFVDPKRLLRGEDVPLEPGDTIEIQP